MIGNWAKKTKKAKKSTQRTSLTQIIASADAARDRGAYDEAATDYRKALSLDPNRFDLWVQYGNMLKDNGRLDDAETAYLEAISCNPTIADTYLQYGHLLKRSGRLEEAADSYRKAVMHDPSYQNSARSELKRLAERGVKSANLPLPSLLAPPQNTALNAKLLSARKEIAELAGYLNKQAAQVGRNADHGPGQADLIKDAYHTVSELLRRLKGAGLDAPITGTDAVDAASTGATVKTTIAFDVSDLYQYFQSQRLPTGIQRVQIEVIPAALISALPELDVRVICFAESDDFWRGIPAAHFVELCELSLQSGDWTAPDWRSAMELTDTLLRQAPPFVFPQGTYLINIGTSWWLQNYFLRVRETKSAYQIRYIPFVHDTIPIMTPEFCVARLTRDFISWVLGVFNHADYYLVNSQATRSDLQKVASVLGHDISDDRIVTVKLDADFRKSRARSADPAKLAEHRLTPGGYVLFVGTVEPRKNHLLAFAVWLRLLKKYGARQVPKLVCVGAKGWLYDAVFEQLGAAEDLQKCVVMLYAVPDDELSLLYENRLFTLYSSVYEGWGLPVTESLCYGKVPLTCNVSSLPEAGGTFAAYFNPGDENDFFVAVERLIFDTAYREKKEKLIQGSYTPRTWQEVSKVIVDAVLLEWAKAQSHFDVRLPTAKLGTYYPLHRNSATKIHRDLVSGEAFRAGDAWWGCDDWGCWLKRMPGRLAIRIGEEVGRCRLYLGLRGLPRSTTSFDVTVLGHKTVRGELEPGQDRWIWFDPDMSGSKDTTIEVVLEGFASEIAVPGSDPRTIALGVIGFMICRADDLESRASLVEAVALENFDALIDQDDGALETPINLRDTHPSAAATSTLAGNCDPRHRSAP